MDIAESKELESMLANLNARAPKGMKISAMKKRWESMLEKNGCIVLCSTIDRPSLYIFHIPPS